VPESQAFCKVTVHIQIATRIYMKGQGVDFTESPSIWTRSIRNLGDKPPQMVQKTSAVLAREGDLGLTAGW